MSVDIEYAIKTDIRNNPVIRDVDTRQRHELRRIVALVVVSVGLLLFSARQHSRMVEYGRAIEVLKVERADERAKNRLLRLNLATLRAHDQISKQAGALGMRPAGVADTLVLERTISPRRPGGILAHAR
jgi:hypothetical protein